VPEKRMLRTAEVSAEENSPVESFTRLHQCRRRAEDVASRSKSYAATNSNRHEDRPRNFGDTTCEALAIRRGRGCSRP
jgi:hypothetical protein